MSFGAEEILFLGSAISHLSISNSRRQDKVKNGIAFNVMTGSFTVIGALEEVECQVLQHQICSKDVTGNMVEQSLAVIDNAVRE